jgi:uncharacterized protein (DUF1810 family)
MAKPGDPPSADPYDLERFVQAQAADYDRALRELRAGKKESHWMWYVFPQLEGLGHSSMSRHYAIKSVAEGRAYLRHPVLGSRLLECANALLNIDGRSAREILGSPDDMKLHSSATLFAHVSDDDDVFRKLLEKYFDNEPDQNTLRLLSRS